MGASPATLRRVLRAVTLLGLKTEPKSDQKPYPEVAAQANFPVSEAEMLGKWQSEGTFVDGGQNPSDSGGLAAF